MAGRIRACRRAKDLSQEQLAKEIGLTRDQLVNIELARARLQVWPALRIARVLRVSLAWLAEGYGPMPLYFPPEGGHIEKDELVKPFLPFYERKLKIPLHRKIAPFIPQPPIFQPVSQAQKVESRLQSMGSSLEDIIPTLPQTVAALLDSCPPNLRAELFLKVNELIREFIRVHDRELREASQELALPHRKMELGLTGDDAFVITESVKAQWPILKRRLRAATMEKKDKTRLADFLGVQLASVAQWLAPSDSAREPGAETALRMLYWVEQQERK